jgi:hypothetical protein
MWSERANARSGITESRTEALDRNNGTGVRAFAASHAVIACVSSQESLDATNHDCLQRGDERWMLYQHDANRPRRSQRPLPISRDRQHVVDEMGSHISHAAAGARGAHMSGANERTLGAGSSARPLQENATTSLWRQVLQ